MAAIKVRCTDGIFRGLSGRVGDFVFRNLKDETMLVFYQPKKKKTEKDLPITDREWTDNASIMARFEEMVKMFHLKVIEKVVNNDK